MKLCSTGATVTETITGRGDRAIKRIKRKGHRNSLHKCEELLSIANTNPEIRVDIILILQDQVLMITQRVVKLDEPINMNPH